MANVQAIHGLDDLKRNLATLSARVGGEITTRALMAGGVVFRDDAKRRAPLLKAPTPRRQRGALRSGIVSYPLKWNHVKVRVRSRTYIFQRSARGTSWKGNPNYWWLVEFGTSKMAAQPFLRPAFESQKMKALQAIVGTYRSGILLAVRGLHRYKLTRSERRLGYVARA